MRAYNSFNEYLTYLNGRGSFIELLPHSSRDEQRRVAVAEKSEIVGKGIVVHPSPVAMQECAHEKEERGLRLVEIRDEHLDDVIPIAWHDDDLCGGMERGELMGIEPIDNGL